MTEPSGRSRKPSEGARLLHKAVKGLTDDEQQVVFEYLLERGMGMAANVPIAFGMRPDEAPASRLSVKRGLSEVGPPGPGQQMVPVRLSEAQYRRLKDWCTEHDFPMSVVIRGLLERFLDDWEQRAA